MIRKFLSKYILEVIPSIVATVVGAYIVTHYINAKPDADKPKAVVAAPVAPAKGVSEDKTAPKQSAEKTSADKADKSETATAPTELRKVQTVPREKTAAKSPAASVPDVQAKADPKPDDTRDANEIARAAIERLRSAEPRRVEPAQDASRSERTKTNTVVYAPVVSQPPVQQSVVHQPMSQQQAIQPAPHVAPPAPAESAAAVGAPDPFPQPMSSLPVARADNSFRPTPPAEIPSRPLDLRNKERTSVAEEVVSTAKDVVSSAKSVFQAVIPGTN